MPGVNVDVLNPGGCPSPADLKSFGIDAVRLVSKPDSANEGNVDPVIEKYLADLKAAGIFGLVVITSESQGHIPANNHGWIQFGNEPDGAPPSSWTMTPDEYVSQFNLYADTYPQFSWVAAGLCAGDFSASFWNTVGPQLHNPAGLALHPYGKSPWQTLALIAAHSNAVPGVPVFITEFNCDASEIQTMLRLLKPRTAGQYWFDWSDAMVSGFGLSDHPDKATAWKSAIASLNQKPPVPPTTSPPKPNIVQKILPGPGNPDGITPSWGYGRTDRGGRKIRFIVNHVAVGNNSLYGWFYGQELSTHYWVSKSGVIEQYVPDSGAAYGQGITTSGSDFPPEYPGNGVAYNQMALSIEREGFPYEEATTAQWHSIVVLNRYLAWKYQIPVDSNHIVAHARTDHISRARCPSSLSMNATQYMNALVAAIKHV